MVNKRTMDDRYRPRRLLRSGELRTRKYGRYGWESHRWRTRAGAPLKFRFTDEECSVAVALSYRHMEETPNPEPPKRRSLRLRGLRPRPSSILTSHTSHDCTEVAMQFNVAFPKSGDPRLSLSIKRTDLIRMFIGQEQEKAEQEQEKAENREMRAEIDIPSNAVIPSNDGDTIGGRMRAERSTQELLGKYRGLPEMHDMACNDGIAPTGGPFKDFMRSLRREHQRMPKYPELMAGVRTAAKLASQVREVVTKRYAGDFERWLEAEGRGAVVWVWAAESGWRKAQ